MNQDNALDQHQLDLRSVENEFIEKINTMEHKREERLDEISFLDSYMESIITENIHNIIDKTRDKKKLLEKKIENLKIIQEDKKGNSLMLLFLAIILLILSVPGVKAQENLVIAFCCSFIIILLIKYFSDKEVKIVNYQIKLLSEEVKRLEDIMDKTENIKINKLIHYKEINKDKIININKKHSEKIARLNATKLKKLQRLRSEFEKKQRELGLVKYKHSSGTDIWGTPEEIANFVKFDTDIESKFSNISPREFEVYIANLLSLLGYSTEITSYGKDFGVDIITEKNEERTVVQVKKYAPDNKVSNSEIQNLLGSMWKFNAQKAIFVTSSSYTDSALKQAENAPIDLWDFNEIKKLSLLLLLSGNKLSYDKLDDLWKDHDELINKKTIICPYCDKDTPVNRNKCINCNRVLVPNLQLFYQLVKPLQYLMNERFVISTNEVTYQTNPLTLSSYFGNLQKNVEGLGKHISNYVHFVENELQVYLLKLDKVSTAARNFYNLYLEQMELFKEFRALKIPSNTTKLNKFVEDFYQNDMSESCKVLRQIREIAQDPEKFLDENVLKITLEYNPIFNWDEVKSELAKFSDAQLSQKFGFKFKYPVY